MKGRIDVDGAVALVTGAGSGIGRATALALAARGAIVWCVDIDGESAAATAAACGAAGAPTARDAVVDVSDRAAMHALADRVHADHPALGILVNNAGVGMTGPFTAASEQDWNWIRSVNLDGVVNGCAVFAPAMLAQRRGHVVNLSSGLAYANTAMEPLYGATKAAVLALSRSLRADWATQGVGVTAVCPGVINTPIITTTRYLGTRDTDEVRAFAAEQFARGHSPEQVASGIIAAIEHDRPVAPVGFESWLVYAMSRLLPSRATQWVLARTPRRPAPVRP